MRPPTYTEPVQTKLEPSMFKKLARLAHKAHMSVSEYVRDLIHRKLEESK